MDRHDANMSFRRGALALLLAGVVLGQSAVVEADDGQRVTAIERRLSLSENYLKSSSAASIAAGGNEQAKQFLNKAREHHDQARRALADGDLDSAIDLADQSIRAYAAASAANKARKKPSGRQQTAENQALRSEIDSYLQAYLSALKEKGPAMAGLLNREQLDELLARAKQHEDAGDPPGANQALRQAQQMVVTALTKIRSNETVVYTLEFQTPADEYRYERQRYDEYLRLARQVMDSGGVQEAKTKMADKVLQKGQLLNGQAEELAGQGKFEDAIDHMEQAVTKLVQGLRLLGVPVSR